MKHPAEEGTFIPTKFTKSRKRQRRFPPIRPGAHETPREEEGASAQPKVQKKVVVDALNRNQHDSALFQAEPDPVRVDPLSSEPSQPVPPSPNPGQLARRLLAHATSPELLSSRARARVRQRL
ncbi:hypothetical protein GOP47_0001120 [Adiantum capillus-veneris]|uniref:Uncharacterized protein n=1 Tax=Adiantum capillus-veneris TaxID=13818 RepID=A0A9D4VG09_ADICA|nr:hypothetical protein GOP47_0001120 [Adiantum capillus-veneris]